MLCGFGVLTKVRRVSIKPLPWPCVECGGEVSRVSYRSSDSYVGRCECGSEVVT